MSLTYLGDIALGESVSADVIRADLSNWLGSRGGMLATGVYGHLRVSWLEGELAEGHWRSRLIVVDDDVAEESRFLFRIDSSGARMRLERQNLGGGSAKAVPLGPPPEFVASWMGADDSLPTSMDSVGDLGERAFVGVSVSDPASSSELRVLKEAERHCRGMAHIAVVPGSVIEDLTSVSRTPCDGRPGSMIVVGRLSAPGSTSVVPATVSIRNPEAAARRAMKHLLSQVDVVLPAEWLEVESELISGGAGLDVERVLEELGADESRWASERSDLQKQNQSLQLELDQLTIDRALDAEMLDQLQTQVRRFQRELARLNVYPMPDPERDELEILPDSCVQAIELAREELPFLSITASTDATSKLDEHQRSLDWAKRLWTLLRGLNDYAECVGSGRYQGSLADYCRNPPGGVLPLPWAKVALQESEATMNNAACYRARIFRVPEGVDSSGQICMPAHLKIDGAPPAPRAHFLDASSSVGKVVVGYVGPHLPIAG